MEIPCVPNEKPVSDAGANGVENNVKVIATIPLRNEAWVCGLSLRVALLWCDEIVVLLHECTDGTSDIVEQVIREHDRGRVHVLRASGDWMEMQHRQAMLEYAREKGATNIAIVDADEVLTGNLLDTGLVARSKGGEDLPIFGTANSHMRKIADQNIGNILQLPGYNLRNGITKYHTNGIWSNRWFSLAFCDDPRLTWCGDTYHSREPRGAVLTPYTPIGQGQGGVMHLWGASERRLRAKSAWYKMDERIRWPQKHPALINRMYSWAIEDRPEVYKVTPQTWTFAEVPESWWAPYRDWMKYLDVDAEPWQESACRKMLAKHGIDYFDGLGLFGVV